MLTEKRREALFDEIRDKALCCSIAEASVGEIDTLNILHATMLAIMGFDHTKLIYNYNGRDFRLTDNFGNVVKEIIA